MTTTNPELEQQVQVASRKFYEELEKRCKRFRPDHFVPSVIGLMRKCHLDGKFVYAPHFQVGLMIEATCAYSRESNNDELTWSKYAQIKNIFHNAEEPAVAHLIERDLGSFMLIMHRQQMELQKSIAKPDIARFYYLYVKDKTTSKLSLAMEAAKGISPKAWLMSSMALYSAAVRNPHGIAIVPPADTAELGKLSVPCIDHFLDTASSTAHEIGVRFKTLRSNTKPIFHNCIRSAFIERPLIKMGQRHYAVPFPEVLLHFASEGLYKILSSPPEFSIEFGNTMRRFVSRAAGNIPGNIKQLDDKLLERVCGGKSCDMVIELHDHIILIESKTSTFQRDIITPDTILGDNSTGKIKKAVEQLISTATDIRNKKLCEHGISHNKPIYGIITTFGDIPFVNAPWYYERFIKTPANEAAILNLFETKPCSMSIRCFELLVIMMHSEKKSLVDLCSTREKLGYGTTGDWDAYLERIASNHSGIVQLPYVQDDFNAFFREFEIDELQI